MTNKRRKIDIKKEIDKKKFGETKFLGKFQLKKGKKIRHSTKMIEIIHKLATIRQSDTPIEFN